MIVSSRLAKSSAVSLALLAHGAVALTLASPEGARIEGASGGAEVRLGSSFADMAAGLVRPEPAKTPAEKADPEKLTPERAKARVEQTPERAPPLLAAIAPAEADSSPRLEALKPDAPETLDLVAAAPAIKPLTADSAPADRLTGEAPKSAAVSRSLRPKMRTPEFEAANKPVAKSRPKPAPQGGGAARSARAGSPTGNEAAKARKTGNNGHKAAPGNAAASNYPGQVMRKLSRAGRPRVNARGTAVVAFSISSAGGLASLSLARSSGSSALDRAALGVVRSAAPFPRPPSGARRSFAIEIKGR
ncbi:TonB family protein [Mameliella sp. CS4]|uniref:energy transducer TonB family protein n=1 Tax=Mameliella sp. CS4 TaxID=2862329 RepID=UPI001C5EA2D8|nr:TonB family protein [Mameliella sp. CS4]MBW4982152.1 TonB family protein [Mameliella sp. CS4]